MTKRSLQKARLISTAVGYALSATLVCWPLSAAASEMQPPSLQDAGRCIQPAADFHKVNPDLLRAILKIESNMRADAVTRNSNGSLDVGIAQTNSIHFQELARHNIAPGHLLDACVSTYVAAWQLSRIVAKHGNSWEAVARYHSATPAHNYRYQVLLRNELVRSGAIAGRVEPVPKVSKASSTSSQIERTASQPERMQSGSLQPSSVRTDRGNFGAPLVVVDGG